MTMERIDQQLAGCSMRRKRPQHQSFIQTAHVLCIIWITLSCCGNSVQCRSWTAIVDPSLYDTSNKDIARVLYATERELFPPQTAMPTVTPSPTEASSEYLPTTGLASSKRPPPPVAPNQRPSLIPTSSGPSFLGSNSSQAPTTRYDNVLGNGGCRQGASLHQVILYDMAGEGTTNTTLAITVVSSTTTTTTTVAQNETRSPFINATAVIHRQDTGDPPATNAYRAPTALLHGAKSFNVFTHQSPRTSSDTSSLSNESSADVAGSGTFETTRNITLGSPDTNVGTFSFQSLNQTGSKNLEYVCLQPFVCYHVAVKGGSRRMFWIIRPILLGTSASVLETLSFPPVATGGGMQGFYTCNFHLLNSTWWEDSDTSCPITCNETQSNSTSIDQSTTSPSASTTTGSTSPSVTFQPSTSPSTSTTTSILPSLTVLPASTTSNPTKTFQPTSTFRPTLSIHPSVSLAPATTTSVSSDIPSQFPSPLETQLDQTESPTRRQRHLTHHPTDISMAAPPTEVKTPFPTLLGE